MTACGRTDEPKRALHRPAGYEGWRPTARGALGATTPHARFDRACSSQLCFRRVRFDGLEHEFREQRVEILQGFAFVRRPLEDSCSLAREARACPEDAQRRSARQDYEGPASQAVVGEHVLVLRT